MSKKIRIAIIGSRGYPYVYSGYETLVKELSERLIKSGIEVTVYCHRKLYCKKPKKINGINLVYTPSINSKVFSQLYNSFFSFIHVCFSNSDIILVVNSANGPFGIISRIFKKKTCINVDGLEWMRPKWKGIGSLYFKISSKLSTLLFDRVITDSTEMKNIYYSKFKVQSEMIAYGPSMSLTDNDSFLIENNLIKKEYYLIVGRLIPDNNSDLIIDGFMSCNSKKKLVIVGDVPYKDPYATKIKQKANNNIVFLGYVNSQENLTQLYKNCFGYIHGHEFGGTNPTMINALFLNCNIISLKTIFSQEMLIGKRSVFFNKDINSVKRAFIYFEKNIKKLKNSNQNYELPNKYRWNYIAQQYLNIFKSLVD